MLKLSYTSDKFKGSKENALLDFQNIKHIELF